MNLLNAALRLFFALLCAAIGLGIGGCSVSAEMKILANPDHYSGTAVCMIGAGIGALFLWAAYEFTQSARTIAKEETPRSAGSTASAVVLAVLVGFLAWLVWGRFFVFKPGRALLGGAQARQTVGNLGMIRSALSIYYGDMEGQYPETLGSLTVGGKYLRELPVAQTDQHPDNGAIQAITSQDADAGKYRDDGGWFYVIDGRNHGNVGVNCVHTDVRGKSWLGY